MIWLKIKKIGHFGARIFSYKIIIILFDIQKESEQKQPPEVLLEISQNPQENNCARVSFLISYLKRDSGTGVFKWILRNF